MSHRWSLLAALPLLLVTGCAVTDSTSGEPIAEVSEAVTENANDKIAFDFFLAKGLTPVQSAGIIGNLDQESSMDPTVSQFGGGPGRGIAQWSAGGRWDTTPNANVVWYAGKTGQSKFALKLQLEFIWWEFNNVGYGFSDLKAATTVPKAVAAFQNKYEICGACASSNRLAHAYQALADFGQDVVGDVWAASYVAQSWPLASAPPIQMKQYEKQTGSIDLKNTGTKKWPAGVVKLAPIPRDKASSFAADTWMSTTRTSTIAADVAPGETGHFEWDLYPQEAGDFAPYFGLVAEGITWFDDSGGPKDNVLQVSVHVEPGPPPSMTSSGAGGDGAGGGGAGGGGASGDGAGGDGAGGDGAGGDGAGGGAPPQGETSASGVTDDGAIHGSCSATATPASAPSGAAFAALALACMAARRRRR
jgi:MYXO-CTERM domain-containing protein